MHLLSGLKRFLQFVLDPDTYCLLWLALRNQLKKPSVSVSASADPPKKRAKAVNIG